MRSPASRMSRASRSLSGQAGWSLAAAAAPGAARARKTNKTRGMVMAVSSLVAQQRRRLGAERLPGTGKSYHKRKDGGEQGGAHDDARQEDPVGAHDAGQQEIGGNAADSGGDRRGDPAEQAVFDEEDTAGI